METRRDLRNFGSESNRGGTFAELFVDCAEDARQQTVSGSVRVFGTGNLRERLEVSHEPHEPAGWLLVSAERRPRERRRGDLQRFVSGSEDEQRLATCKC